MVERSGLRFGVDGYPYVAGLAGATLLLSTCSARLVRSEHPWSRRAGIASAVVAAATAVPAVAGLHYVLVGKLRLRDLMLDLVRWRGEETVADLGSGLGLLGVGAASRTSGTVHCIDLFVGKDLLGNAPERLRRNAERCGVERQIDIRREDVRALSLSDRSVDVVLSALCLHNIAGAGGRAEAVAEIGRILRPGGLVVLSDLEHVDDEYAPALRAAGLHVETLGRVRGTFPPQRLLVARSPARPQV